MGQTPLDKLPYPEPTDQIRLMAQHVKNLATALDPDPTWVPLTLMNSWTAWTADYTPRVRRFGSVVQVQALLRPGAVTYGAQLLTLPVGFRPGQAVYLACATQSGSGQCAVSAWPDGRLVHEYGGAANLWFSLDSAAWIAGS